MAVEVYMPKMSDHMNYGEIVNWLANEGDRVQEGQVILEITTDKVTAEIEAPAAGVLKGVRVGAEIGAEVPVGEAIAFIAQEDEEVPGLPPLGKRRNDSEKESSVQTEAQVPIGDKEIETISLSAKYAEQHGLDSTAGEDPPRVKASPAARRRARELDIDLSSTRGTGPGGLVREEDVEVLHAGRTTVVGAVTPLAKKVASIHDVDLRTVKGTGIGGRITKADVIQALNTPKVETATLDGQAGFLVTHSVMRKTIARRMRDSLHVAAQANHRMDVDVSELVRMRQILKASEIEVSYNDILIKITAAALQDVPVLNSTWTDAGLIIKEEINIGMAVALDEGLIVPVVHNADSLTLELIHIRTRELIDKVQTGSIGQEDMEWGTFTLTNLGMFDIDSFTAIINQPESGILAVGRIRETPTAVGGTVEIRPLMTLSLTYDHRAVDGAPAARFLQRIKQYIENPYLLL